MKFARMALASLLIMAGIVLGGSAWAHGGGHYRGHHGSHLRFGVFIGAPAYWHFAPRPYYYPPVIAAPASPPVYIERGSAEPSDQSQGYWYYCADDRAYYPYVKQCPGGWQRVPAQPSPG